MALEYFLYTTLYNNTLVNRSNSSFAPLPPDTGEIQIDFLIPRTQPLYLYRESGDTIILNDDATINAYLEDTTTPPDGDTALTYAPFTGYTATTKDNFDNFTGTTLPANYYNKTEINVYSASTQADINTRVYRSGDTMTGTLCTTSNLLANGAVTGSSLAASVLMTTPVLNASTSISAPQITGSTCITSPISCATTRMQAPVVCGGTCVVSPITFGSTCVCSPTICSSTCLCSTGTARITGAVTAASTLNVSGDTRIGGNTYLDNADTGGTLSDYSVVWNPVTKEIRTLSNTGGTACVYCYVDKRTIQANTTQTNATYLTQTWSLPAGYYEYEFNAIYGNNTSNRCAIVCFLVNGNVVGYCNLLKTNDTNAVSTAYVTQNNQLTAGSYTPSIVFRQCGGGTASIYFGTIRIQKIGETA